MVTSFREVEVDDVNYRRPFLPFLRCETKAYNLSRAVAGDSRASHSISDWKRDLAERFRRECRDLLTSINPAGCLLGTPSRHDLATGQHRYIINPILTFEDMRSRIDALEWAPLPAQKAHNRYIPIRFISSEKVTKEHKLHLGFDALVLGKICDQAPILGKLIHGTQKTVMSVKLNELIRSVEILVQKIRVTLANFTSPDLVLIAHCSECEFEVRCRSKANEDDNLSLLGGMSTKEVLKLRRRGIFTVTQLSYTFRPRKKSKRSSKVTVPYYHPLKALAIREKRIYVAAALGLNIGGTPVYLDVEGVPDRDFYYLIGVRLPSVASTVQRSLWADDNAGEETIWQQFLDIIATIENPQLFHYGSYETAFLRRMRKRYGDGGEKGISVERLIQGAQNVLSAIYGRVYFPTYTNGLKEIASFLGFKWSTENPSGQRSLLLRHKWELSRSMGVKEELIAYNADDCEALELVAKAIQEVNPDEGGPAGALHQLAATHVDSLKPAWPYSLGRVDFAFPELHKINKCAYWDYQRDRIYIRTNPALRHVSRLKKRKRRRSLPVNVTLGPSRPRSCPSCNSKKIGKNGRHSKLLYDIRFSAGGVKRWVSRFITVRYKCRDCGSTFASDQYHLTKHRYGLQLLAYVIHNIIELHIPQFKLSSIIQRTFHYQIGQPTINRLKQRAVELYQDTYEEIKHNLLRGKLIHADETHVSAKGRSSYVWVFTSMCEVIYIWSETRQGSVAENFLRGFKGVLGSDFYSAYDAIDCAQQRCLIHLIRDFNNDVLQEPFNEEFKEIVRRFAALLKPMIETIERFGLKTHFLKKYKRDVTRFFDATLEHKYETELAQKAQERLKRNQERLFTFLDYDNIPWNNNNAEHAIKAFAGLRDVIEGPSTKEGISDYLMLLSICQTCEYRGIDFLGFLRSGEKQMNEYARRRHR